MDVNSEEESQLLEERKDGKDGPSSPKKLRMAQQKEPAVRKGEKVREEEWEAKRRKTVILKGLTNSTRTAVVDFLVKFGFAREQDVLNVESRKVNLQEWSFIQFHSSRVVDNRMSTKAKKLRNTSFFLQRDLNKAARSKEREERLKRNAQPLLKGVHPQRQAQIVWPAQADSPQSKIPHQPQQAVQTPAAISPNGQHNFPQFPNGRMVGAPPLRVEQFPYYIRPGNQYQVANAGILPQSMYSPLHPYPAPLHPSGWVC